MTTDDLRKLRAAWGLTQLQMATRMGLTRRNYISLEVGDHPLRTSHILSIERISIDIAVEKGDVTAIPDELIKKIIHIYNFYLNNNDMDNKSSQSSVQNITHDIDTKNQHHLITSKHPRTSARLSHNRHIDHNAILDRWAAGWGVTELANYAQTTSRTIYDLIGYYRYNGDHRAIKRRETN